jgi:hypothetical protein
MARYFGGYSYTRISKVKKREKKKSDRFSSSPFIFTTWNSLSLSCAEGRLYIAAGQRLLLCPDRVETPCNQIKRPTKKKQKKHKRNLNGQNIGRKNSNPGRIGECKTGEFFNHLILIDETGNQAKHGGSCMYVC